jgi:hypothetical protein
VIAGRLGLRFRRHPHVLAGSRRLGPPLVRLHRRDSNQPRSFTQRRLARAGVDAPRHRSRRKGTISQGDTPPIGPRSPRTGNKSLPDRKKLLRRRPQVHARLLHTGQVVGDLLGRHSSAQELNDRTVIPVVLVRGFLRVLHSDRIPLLHQQTSQLLASTVFPPPVVLGRVHLGDITRLIERCFGLTANIAAGTRHPPRSGCHDVPSNIAKHRLRLTALVDLDQSASAGLVLCCPVLLRSSESRRRPPGSSRQS